MIALSTRVKQGAPIDMVIKYAPVFPRQFNLFSISSKDEMDFAIGCIQSVKGYFTRAISMYSRNRGLADSDVALEPLFKRVSLLDDSLKLAYKQKNQLSNIGTKSAALLYGPVQSKTRYCPDHVGVGQYRLSDDIFQCPMDGKKYNYVLGFEKIDGEREQGGSINNQIIKDPIMYTVVPKPIIEVVKN